MKINPIDNQSAATPGRAPREESAAAPRQTTRADILTLSGEAETMLAALREKDMGRGDATDAADPYKPTISAAEFTRRLVGARTPFEVRHILSEAGSELLKLRIGPAMSSDPATAAKAKRAIRQLEKLIDRGGRKIGDLNREADIKARELKAKKDKDAANQRRHSEKLRQKQAKRRARERGYLFGEYEPEDNRPLASAPKTAYYSPQISPVPSMSAAAAPAPAAEALSDAVTSAENVE